MRVKAKPRKKLGALGEERRWRQRARYLIAMGTLATHSATVGTKASSLAYAQQAPKSHTQQTADADATVHRFDIPAGPLDVVLRAFTRSTGISIEVSSEQIRGVQSPGITGAFTVSQALAKMTEGTKLSAILVTPTSARIEFEQNLQTVEVTSRITTLSSPKYTEPLRDTPATVTVISQAMMEEQGATTLRDALRNVTGLTVTAGEGGTPAGDNLSLRGMSIRNDIFVDGVRDLSPQSRDPFNYEQVEVVKGSNSAIAGRSSGAGTINLVNKTANLNRYFGGTLSLGNADFKRTTADINLPLKRLGLGERTAFRLNGVYNNGAVPGRDVIRNSRWGVAPTLTFGLATPTRFTFSYYKLKQNNISDYGIPWVSATSTVLPDYRNQPVPVPRDTFYGFVDRDHEWLNSDVGTFRFEHDFSDEMHIRNQLRYGRSTRDSNATPPRMNGDTLTVVRDMRAWIALDKIWDNQTDFNAKFRTGFLEHSFAGGAEFTGENNIRQTRSGTSVTTSLFDPNPYDVYTGTITPGENTGNVSGVTQAAYASDTIKAGEHVQGTIGWRVDRFNVDGVTTANVLTARLDTMNTLRGALTYKPVQAGSFYAAYSSAMSPSLEGLTYSTSNTSIPPEKTYNTEVGTKWDVLRSRLSLTGALFRVAKDNARTPGLLQDDPPQVLAGTQVSRGVELGINGRITSNLNLFASYTLLDARIRSSNTPAEIGKYFQNTPKNSYSIWSTYQYKRLLVGAGPQYVGLRYADNANTKWVPSYWTLNALASVNVTDAISLRFNITNANDAYYFDRLSGGRVIPGAARTYQVSTNFHF